MAEYSVIKLGNPLLRLISKPIADDEYGTIELYNLANNLFKVMKLESSFQLRRIDGFLLFCHPLSAFWCRMC